MEVPQPKLYDTLSHMNPYLEATRTCTLHDIASCQNTLQTSLIKQNCQQSALITWL